MLIIPATTASAIRIPARSRRARSTKGGATCSSCWPAASPARRWPHGPAREALAQAAAPGKLAPLKARSPPCPARRPWKSSPTTRTRQLQQLLRVRHRQGRPGARTPHTLQDPAVDGRGRGRGQEARQVRHRGPAQAQRAGRAHLPPALRRGLVDGDPVGRLFAGRADQEGRAAGQRQVRGVRHAGRPEDRCPSSARACSTGPTSRACAWTRRCIR